MIAQALTPTIPNINHRPAGGQLVRDVSDDYTMLSFLTRHGWRITASDDRAGWYWATRTCKRLKN
ncbi:hypothetical protein HZU75_04330 [Chitinibacter fontanus]|uniref:Uncharacterized protein n=1 Tax=Chitinibacter fontanus TaxID=1737446 RepID=A0A7D5V8Q5_9NEIS|nr:hypothetical protein [Chitinibacter fontanus]QLI80818.1 hypothetical protein HZU75_04330 [Chitinibacter fontanus]